MSQTSMTSFFSGGKKAPAQQPSVAAALGTTNKKENVKTSHGSTHTIMSSTPTNECSVSFLMEILGETGESGRVRAEWYLKNANNDPQEAATVVLNDSQFSVIGDTDEEMSDDDSSSGEEEMLGKRKPPKKMETETTKKFKPGVRRGDDRTMMDTEDGLCNSEYGMQHDSPPSPAPRQVGGNSEGASE
jgi:hypothetical protein